MELATQGGTVMAKWSRQQYKNYMRKAPYRHEQERAHTNSLSDYRDGVDLARRYYAEQVEPRLRTHLAGNTVRVSERQLPTIHKAGEQSAAALGMDAPDLYMHAEVEMQAVSYGMGPHYISLSSGAVDAMTTAEIRFVIGHELGHAASDHVLWGAVGRLLLHQVGEMAQQTRNERLAALQRYEQLRDIAARAYSSGTYEGMQLAQQALYEAQQIGNYHDSLIETDYQWQGTAENLAAQIAEWQPLSELSADRAGLLCAQKLDAAASCIVKLTSGSSRLADQVDVGALLEQASELDPDARGHNATHPLMVHRIAYLKTWHTEDRAQRLLEIAKYLIQTR
jgi:Zn-dependent protease with chaperone function